MEDGVVFLYSNLYRQLDVYISVVVLKEMLSWVLGVGPD
jgi:hypothetical protein